MTRSLAAPAIAFALAFLLTACASGPPAAPPTPPPVPVLPPPATGDPLLPGVGVQATLEPSAAALRAADRAELTGIELGRMWTFENPPLDYWREEYGFTATPEWLEKVRLASVRYGEICSASFVSPTGLVMTNHHCARSCVEAVSTGTVDYVETGFYARTQDDEVVCPDLYLDQLVAISDVTARVRQAVPAGVPAERATEAQADAIESIEQECQQQTDRQCQVVSLYQGGQHQLYQYRRFSPVKLVFSPELQAGFFGGDPDNFTYPRYALDVSFVRAYDGAQPASTPNYFPWRAEGAEEGELVFLTGNPGSTSRLITVSQLLYEQRYRHPFLVQLLSGQRQLLQTIAAMGPEAERQVRQDVFEVENSLKAFSGQLAGLRDTLLVGQKIRWERELRQAIESDAQLRNRFGDLWSGMAELQRRKFEVSPRLNVANRQFVGAPQFVYAGELIRYLREMAKPEAQRSQQFQPMRQQIEAMLRGPTQTDETVARGLLQLHLEIAAEWLDEEDPLLRRLIQRGETPQQAAARLLTASRILDPQFRSTLLTGGITAAEAERDPFVQFALIADTAYTRLDAEWAEIQAEQQVQAERLAEALFAVHGTKLPPDATFTLRIADGRIARYPYNGTIAPPVTSFYGMYERAANFDNEMPWTLPATFEQRRAAVDMAAPLNMVSTNDITGGNSGSPVIDQQARVVGLAFDGNIEQLPNEFVFRTEAARTISVHSAGILEALRNVYQAQRIVNELTGAGR